MNSLELKEMLSEAKRLGYWESRFDYKVLDHEYYFERQLKSGYELEGIEYPCDDKGKKFSFPRAKFKFNKAMEKDFKIQIQLAELSENYFKELSKLKSELYARDKGNNEISISS